jgi:hypothetical protein
MAISCHETVVETILAIKDRAHEEAREPARDDVVYVTMNKRQRVALLSDSLKNLGILY